MNIIKLAVLSIVFLFCVATAISLMIPSHIRISKAINIHADKDSVLSLIDHQDRWRQWHPAFIQGDSVRKFPPITITTIYTTDSSVVVKMQQGNKKPVVNGWQVYTHSSTDSLTLQWYMDFNLKWYPWQKFGSLFYENTYGLLMEQGLANIKKIVDK